MYIFIVKFKDKTTTLVLVTLVLVKLVLVRIDQDQRQLIAYLTYPHILYQQSTYFTLFSYHHREITKVLKVLSLYNIGVIIFTFAPRGKRINRISSTFSFVIEIQYFNYKTDSFN